MKKLVNLLLLLSLPNLVYSQAFPMDSATWEVDYKCFDPSEYYYTTLTIDIGGNVEIDNENYAFLNFEVLESSLVRVEGDKVYFRELPGESDTLENLMFDFGLGVGDTFNYPDYQQTNLVSMLVESIDTIVFLDGIERRRINFKPDDVDICVKINSWVEGIGAMPYPFYHLINHCFECWWIGFRFYQNGKLVIDQTSPINELKNEKTNILIYPNPTIDYFSIESSSIQIEEIKILNITGEYLLHRIAKSNKCDFKIPENTPKGLYIVSIKFEDNNTIYKKLLVE